MARYRDTIASPKSAEDVFDYMAMFSNVSQWDPTAAEAHPIDGNAAGQGGDLGPKPTLIGGVDDDFEFQGTLLSRLPVWSYCIGERSPGLRLSRIRSSVAQRTALRVFVAGPE